MYKEIEKYKTCRIIPTTYYLTTDTTNTIIINSDEYKANYGDLINDYLRVDDDGDYVMRSTPCSFLGEDNYCSIYDVRPTDCERFPYTNEDVLLKRQPLTLKNSTFCPAVYYVLEKLMAITK